MLKPTKPITRPKPIVVQARIEGGELKVPARKVLLSALKHWPDGPVDLEVRPFEETRRGRANRFYRGVILKLIAQHSGYTPDELHEIFKVRHNSKLVADPATGEEIRIGQTTTKLTISQFSDYLDACMCDGAEWWGVSFPEPRPAEDWRTRTKAEAA
jgi:hypothetical protein